MLITHIQEQVVQNIALKQNNKLLLLNIKSRYFVGNNEKID